MLHVNNDAADVLESAWNVHIHLDVMKDRLNLERPRKKLVNVPHRQHLIYTAASRNPETKTRFLSEEDARCQVSFELDRRSLQSSRILVQRSFYINPIILLHSSSYVIKASPADSIHQADIDIAVMGGKCAREARMSRPVDRDWRPYQPARPQAPAPPQPPHRRGSVISSESDGLIEPTPPLVTFVHPQPHDPAIDETWRFIWDRAGYYSPPISPCCCMPDGRAVRGAQTGEAGSPPGDPSHGHTCVKREPSSDRELKRCSVESVCSRSSSDFTIILPPILEPNAGPAWGSMTLPPPPTTAAAAGRGDGGRTGHRQQAPHYDRAPSSSRSETSTAMLLGVLQRHHTLFDTLRSICTMAARYCWYNEAREWAPPRTYLSVHPKHPKPASARHNLRQFRGRPYGVMPNRSRFQPVETRLPPGMWVPDEGGGLPPPPRYGVTETLMMNSHRPRHDDALHRYVFRIADALWNRGKREVCAAPRLVPSTDVEKDALGRMQALFRLADRVVDAAKLVNHGTWIADLDLDLDMGFTGVLRFFKSGVMGDGARGVSSTSAGNSNCNSGSSSGNGNEVNGYPYSSRWAQRHMFNSNRPTSTPKRTPNHHGQTHTHPPTTNENQTQTNNRSLTPDGLPLHPELESDELLSDLEGVESDLEEGELEGEDDQEILLTEHLSEVFSVLVAARDLCALCSYDAGVRAVELAWQEWEEGMVRLWENGNGNGRL